MISISFRVVAVAGLLVSVAACSSADPAAGDQSSDNLDQSAKGDGGATALAARDGEVLRCTIEESKETDPLSHVDTLSCAYRLDAKALPVNFVSYRIEGANGHTDEVLLREKEIDGTDATKSRIPQIGPSTAEKKADTAYPLTITGKVSLAGGIEISFETKIASPSAATVETPLVVSGAFQVWPLELVPTLGNGTRALSVTIDPPKLEGVTGLTAKRFNMLKPDATPLVLLAPLKGGLTGKVVATMTGGKTVEAALAIPAAGRYVLSADGAKAATN